MASPRVTPRLDERRVCTAQNLPNNSPGLSSRISSDAVFASLLERLLTAVHAPPGASGRTAGRHSPAARPSPRCGVGLDEASEDPRHVAARCRHLWETPLPSSSSPENGHPGEGLNNPTEHPVLFAPIASDNRVVGLVEIFHATTFDPTADPAIGQAIVSVAALLAHYLQNRQRKDLSTQQHLWQQLETFARDVHASLEPAEVASVVANEGLRLTGGDRFCVAVRHGSKVVIEAVSGTDRVEKNSNLVHKLRVLCRRAMDRGEKLVYSGVADESLPPDLLEALNVLPRRARAALLVVLRCSTSATSPSEPFTLGPRSGSV